MKTNKIDFKNIKQKIYNIFLNFPETYLIPLFICFFIIILAISTHGFDVEMAKNGGYKKEIFIANWYAIFIMTGIVFAVIFSLKEIKKLHINTDIILTGIIIIVPSSIIGARLYYVITSPTKYTTFLEAIAIWQGGLAITGAIITAFSIAIIFARIKKIPLLHIIDVIAIGFLIGQIIGRWGNFINQEAHGIVSSNDLKNFPEFIKWQMHFTDTNTKGVIYQGPQFWQPTFFYESSLNFLVLLVFLVIRRFRLLKTGDLFGFYLIWYGILRGLVIEPLRQDPLVIGNFKVNVLFSLFGLALAGVIYLVLKNILFPKLSYYKDISKGNDLTYKQCFQKEKKIKKEYITKNIFFDIDSILEKDKTNNYLNDLKRLEKDLKKIDVNLIYLIDDNKDYKNYKLNNKNNILLKDLSFNELNDSNIIVSNNLNILNNAKSLNIPTLILGIYSNYYDLNNLGFTYSCVNVDDIKEIIEKRG